MNSTCYKTQYEQAQARANYRAAWPNACKHCGGTGEIRYTDDPSAFGVSLAPGSMEFSDPCPQCIDRDDGPHCPRCAAVLPDEVVEDETAPCPACGWVYDETPGMPDDQCYCWSCEPDLNLGLL
jgi:hypothetical protein